eukprot:gene26490-35150_t
MSSLPFLQWVCASKDQQARCIMNLQQAIFLTFLFFAALSFFLFIQHELFHQQLHFLSETLPAESLNVDSSGAKLIPKNTKERLQTLLHLDSNAFQRFETNLRFIQTRLSPDSEVNIQELIVSKEKENENEKEVPKMKLPVSIPVEPERERKPIQVEPEKERKGLLYCNGKQTDSEVIYWKIVPGDNTYESPITPHHGMHHDRYITFEYDHGGWNNARIGMECLIVVAHATGRTIVIPPQQHLYLLAHDEMGFEDFFDVQLLRSHSGFHLLHMDEFLSKEGVTGGLHGKLPPDNSSDAWGQKLWTYLSNVADESPAWLGKYIVFPAAPGDFNMKAALANATVQARLKRFVGDRGTGGQEVYGAKLQAAHHIHVPGDDNYRILQHHYAFAFFADPEMQSFYRRFVRDYMRYKDDIQCAGAELLAMVREDAMSVNPDGSGDFYALHIRRGDLQFKEVKIGAEEMVKNLHYKNGTAIIPRGSLVYISTDDPDGKCKGCLVQRKPCEEYRSPKPVGCPEDTSWNAFLEAGWKIRFMRDYMPLARSDGVLREANPNTFGMLESIVCSRAKIFAGTFFSTFTGYIHRLRGYHGLGEATYYHSTGHVFSLQHHSSNGHGWSREYRAGWTDDGGEII